MTLKIRNCNSILEANIEIKQKKSTIILAKNGTGKSTISKALELSLNEGNLNELKSYSKHISGNPEVEYTGPEKSIMIFDDRYSSNFIFVGKELLDSDKTYELMQENDIYRSQKKILEETIQNLQEVVLNTIKSSMKPLEDFNKIRNKSNKSFFIPKKSHEGLVEKNPFLDKSKMGVYNDIISHIEKKSEWTNWRDQYQLIFKKDNYYCPYCAQTVNESLSAELKNFSTKIDIKAVTNREKLWEIATNISNMSSINIEVIDRVVNYGASIDNKTNSEKLIRITKETEGIVETLRKLQKITVANLTKSVDRSEIDNINVKHLKKLNNYGEIEQAFTQLLSEKKKIIGLSNNLNKILTNALHDHVSKLNEFCVNTGIPYSFKIMNDNNMQKVVMNYIGTENRVSLPQDRLSYGEKNAISCYIFALISKHQKTDLIVLDDPFSSFDEHKRHYLYKALFGSKGILKSKTIIFLTHDVEPVYDLVYLKVPTKVDKCIAIENQRGIVNAISISNKDINSFKISLIKSINESSNEIVKLVYLRKLIEVLEKTTKIGKKNNFYYGYQYISSYIKGGELLIKESNRKFRNFTDDEITEARDQISDFLARHEIGKIDFTYNQNTLEEVISCYKDIENSFESLMYMRYLLKRNLENGDNSRELSEEVDYFLNLVQHYEKETLLKIDPSIYSSIPEFIKLQLDYQYEKLNTNNVLV